MRLFLTTFSLFALTAVNIYAVSVEVLTPKLRVGETLVVKFNEAPKSITFDGKNVSPFPYQKSWRVVVPLPLSAKTGSYRFRAELTDGQIIERIVSVSKKTAKIVMLPPPPKLGLTPEEIVQNLAIANNTVRKTVEEVQDITLFSQPFGLPLSDNRKISSAFGEIRKTGEESIIHLGTDFDSAKGRVVAAINAGVVKSAYLDPIYGNSIIIDHGRGIYSLYLHLNEMKVKAGEAVKKGTFIGTVGDSGLANAPHLHLSVKIDGVSVDPLQFVSSFR